MKISEFVKKIIYLPHIVILFLDFWAMNQYSSYYNRRDGVSDLKFLVPLNVFAILYTLVLAVFFYVKRRVKEGTINIVSMLIYSVIATLTLFLVGFSICNKSPTN